MDEIAIFYIFFFRHETKYPVIYVIYILANIRNTLAPASRGFKNLDNSWVKKKQGNRRDMQKINVTRQFLGASGPHGHFFEKNKKTRF